MSTLPAGPISSSALTAAGYVVVDGSGQRVQIWAGILDDGSACQIAWDSSSTRKVVVTFATPAGLYRSILGVAAVLNDIVQASGLGAGAKAAAQQAILDAIRST